MSILSDGMLHVTYSSDNKACLTTDEDNLIPEQRLKHIAIVIHAEALLIIWSRKMFIHLLKNTEKIVEE